MNRRTFLGAAAAGAISAALNPPIHVLGSPTPTRSAASVPNSTLVVCAHPDDDTLGAGAIIRAEKAAGKNVYVLMVTRGEATDVLGFLNGDSINSWAGYLHDPAGERYLTDAGVGLPLTVDDIKNARSAEFARAARCLAVDDIRYANLPDGDVADHATELQAAIEAYAADIGGLIDLKVHSYRHTVTSGSTTTVVEDHPDHLAVGAAGKAIAASAPAWLNSIRYFIIWSLHGSSFPGLTVARVNTAGTDAGRVRTARHSYGAWAPELGSYAIGDHSVHAALEALEADPHSLYHST